jgi:hypothetical protein
MTRRPAMMHGWRQNSLQRSTPLFADSHPRPGSVVGHGIGISVTGDARDCRMAFNVAAALSGGLAFITFAGTVWLWACYGATVFFETGRAGLAACFG